VAKRNPYSRWRRLPPVFRSGEHKIPGPGEEPQRIILYLRGDVLDQAESLAEKEGVPTLQEYCAQLLARAIEVERVKHHVAEVEAKRGPLQGFNEISGDPHYLTEWREQSDSKDVVGGRRAPAALNDQDASHDTDLTIPVDSLSPSPPAGESEPVERDEDSVSEDLDHAPPSEPPRIRIEQGRLAIAPAITERIVPEVLDSSAVEVLLSHVGPGDKDPHAFLPAMRRGHPVPSQKITELMDALNRLELDHERATMLDRRLAYGLHRLAMESQVLLTEAWPGAFDGRMQAAIREVQERVERILSGQDIRYYQPQDGPASRQDHE
jgi:hypothetical protein